MEINIASFGLDHRLQTPFSQLEIVDIDQNGDNELIAIEGTYENPDVGNLTIWKWQGFGFTLLNRLEGKFSAFSMENIGNGIIVTPY